MNLKTSRAYYFNIIIQKLRDEAMVTKGYKIRQGLNERAEQAVF